MRMTVTIDEGLLEKAQDYTGLTDSSAVVNEALKVLIERYAARRLARLGGSDPELAPPPRQALNRRG